MQILGYNRCCRQIFFGFRDKIFAQFFDALSTLFKRSSEHVLMKFLYAIRVPTLTYACDAFPYSNKQLNSMNIALNDSIRRVFTYNRWESVTYLRLVFGFPSLVEIFHQRTQRFLKLIPRTRNPTLVAIKALDDT